MHLMRRTQSVSLCGGLGTMLGTAEVDFSMGSCCRGGTHEIFRIQYARKPYMCVPVRPYATADRTQSHTKDGTPAQECPLTNCKESTHLVASVSHRQSPENTHTLFCVGGRQAVLCGGAERNPIVKRMAPHTCSYTDRQTSTSRCGLRSGGGGTSSLPRGTSTPSPLRQSAHR